MAKRTLHIPAAPQRALQLLAEMLTVARKNNKWRQHEVAQRLNVTRQTVARLEKGDPNVNAGCYFAAAWLLDVPIFPLLDERTIKPNDPLKQLLTLLKDQLPKRVSGIPEKPVDDNF